MGLAENIRRLMYEQRMSQVALAKASKVSRFTIGEVLASRTDPAQSTLEKLAAALGVKVSDLFQEQAKATESHVIAQNRANKGPSQSAAKIEAKLVELEKEMIRGFARIEAMLQMKK